MIAVSASPLPVRPQRWAGQLELRVLLVQTGLAAAFCLGAGMGWFGAGGLVARIAVVTVALYQAVRATYVLGFRLRGRSLEFAERASDAGDLAAITLAWIVLGDPLSQVWVLYACLLTVRARTLRGRDFVRFTLYALSALVIGRAGAALASGSSMLAVDLLLATILTIIAAAFGYAVGAASRAAEEDALQLAGTDPLTGLPNRRALIEQLELLGEGQRLAALMLDLDDFKQVNDHYGHEAGDQVLMRAASLLSANTREEDLVARYGGEEFVLVLPDVGPRQALATAMRIRDRVGAGSPVTATIGVTVRKEGESVEQTLARADRLLLRAKKAGKDRVMTDLAVSPEQAA